MHPPQLLQPLHEVHPAEQLPLQCPIHEFSQLSAHVLTQDPVQVPVQSPVQEFSQLSAHVMTQDPVQS